MSEKKRHGTNKHNLLHCITPLKTYFVGRIKRGAAIIMNNAHSGTFICAPATMVVSLKPLIRQFDLTSCNNSTGLLGKLGSRSHYVHVLDLAVNLDVQVVTVD